MQKYRVGLYTAPEAPDTTSDLAALQEIHEKSKPLVLKTEALANKIFPGDGKPIIQGNILRTKFGKSILIVEFRKRSKETTALSTLKQFSFSVAFLARPWLHYTKLEVQYSKICGLVHSKEWLLRFDHSVRPPQFLEVDVPNFNIRAHNSFSFIFKRQCTPSCWKCSDSWGSSSIICHFYSSSKGVDNRNRKPFGFEHSLGSVQRYGAVLQSQLVKDKTDDNTAFEQFWVWIKSYECSFQHCALSIKYQSGPFWKTSWYPNKGSSGV